MKKAFTWFLRSIFCLATFVGMIHSAHSATDITTFTNDIYTLIIEGNQLVARGNSLTLTRFNMRSQLESGSDAVSEYLGKVETVYKSLEGSGSLTLTNDALVSLQTLSSTVAGMADALSTISNQVVTLAAISSLSSLESSLSSMLSLSSDIGTMADRIGEMADRILVMADNIGIMSDRILATQLIQNNNIELTYATILESQKNTLMLFSMFSL